MSQRKDFRILVVDDDEDMRALLKVALESKGWVVIPVGSAEEALKVWSEAGPHAMVVDQFMPVKGGTEFGREVLDKISIPTFIFTASPDLARSRNDIQGMKVISKSELSVLIDELESVEAATRLSQM